MSTVIPIIIFILILSAVIFIHEFGHFFFARRAGIFVEEFAMGMGPKLLSWRGKKLGLDKPDGTPGEATLYSIRMFPIGGFCKMRGQDEDVPDDPEAMNNKNVWQRILVIAGGSVMNFVMAFVLFFIIVMLLGHPVAEVVGITPGMPGYEAGLRVGDRITHINGSRVTLYENFMFVLDVDGSSTMDVRVDRAGERVDLQITPIFDAEDEVYRIGFNPGRRIGLLTQVPDEIMETGLFHRVTLGGGIVTTAEMLGFHIQTPFRLLARLLTRQGLPAGTGVMGPIGLAGQVTDVYQQVIQYSILDTFLIMLNIAAMISAALGIMNLLPIPALDGARLIFLAIEAVRGKPVSPEREAVVHMVGFVLMIGLAIFIAYRDILRLI